MTVIDLKTEAFNTKQVRAIVGITTKNAVHWDAKGLVKPSVRPASGRGSQRLYSYEDLLALRVVRGLRDQGLPLQRVRKCVSYLRGHMPDISQPLTFCRLVTDGQTVFLFEDQKTLIDTVKRPGQRAFLQMVDVAEFDRRIRERAMELTVTRVETVRVGDYAYQVQIEPDTADGGYTASVSGLPGCITDGDTLEDVVVNAKDAIECWLAAHEELADQGIDVPMRHPRRRRKLA